MNSDPQQSKRLAINPAKSVIVSVAFTPDEKQAIMQAANLDNRSVSQFINLIVMFKLKQESA
tara:strand:- start:415 stop:600 length:186 start_codon:yes stop_codon:yes gene_type:complete